MVKRWLKSQLRRTLKNTEGVSSIHKRYPLILIYCTIVSSLLFLYLYDHFYVNLVASFFFFFEYLHYVN